MLLNRLLCVLTLSALSCWVFTSAAQDTPSAELAMLLSRALHGNPAILAARDRIEQALARHEELLGFFDPGLYAAGGKAERARGVPGGSGFHSVTNDSHEIQVGAEAALQPGAYLNVGTVHRFLTRDSDYNHLYQSLIGVRLRIPLLRDSGFLQWELQRCRAMAEYHAAVGDMVAVMQLTQRQVESAYINAYETLAVHRVSQLAGKRFEVLLAEARELTRLQVVPSYQIHPAEMEYTLQKEEEERSGQAHGVSLLRLGGAVGDGRPATLAFGPERLVQVARELRELRPVHVDEALARRGSHMLIEHRVDAVKADLRRTEDDLKPDFYLHAGATWMGEDPHYPLGSRTIRTERGLGGEVALVWERPIGYHAERGRLAQYRARIAELEHSRDDLRVTVETDLTVAALAYSRLKARIELLDRALESAAGALEAERERFRLGEGRSRDVLDAEKDLTSIQLQQTRAAAEMLRARNDYRYAAGYPDAEPALAPPGPNQDADHGTLQ
ncbi:MAG: TolC family protein [Lentisphaeria bacterium]|nr:TolC family protein [Lentisphaeria bacterium]